MQHSTSIVASGGANRQIAMRSAQTAGQVTRGRADARAARLLSAPLQIEERPASGAARGVILLALLLVAGFITWAALVPIREVTIAQGEVTPAGFAQTVQHLEGGLVAQVFARDGDTVAAGDPLLRLNDIGVTAQLAQAAARRDSLVLSIRRLEAVAAGGAVELGRFEGGQPGDRMADLQQATADSQLAQRNAELLEAMRATERSRAEQAAATVTLADLQAERALVAAMVARRRPLIASGLMRLPEVEAIERDALRLNREIAATEAQGRVLAITVAESEARRVALEARLRQQSLQQIVQAQVELAEANAAHIQLTERAERLTLRAPVGGVIQQSAVRRPGTVLAPGAAVAEIVPIDQTMFAQVQVLPQDIGYVRRGGEALVKVSTYDYVRFGGIAGTIDAVSPAAIAQPDGTAAFIVRVRLAQQFVGTAAQGMRLGPGMTVTAEIVGGEKTFLEYLLKPVRAAFGTAMRER